MLNQSFTKPIVFISHISEEREIAIALKKLIEDNFMGMMDVFVSSSPDSIQLGQKWLDKIDFALKHCAVEIVIASPVSLRRQWVNFEAGAGWVRGIPVIPLCHSGMVRDKLPKPLDSFQAANATESAELELIFPVLATALGSGIPKNVDFSEFVATVKAFEAVTAQSIAVSEDSVIPSSSGLARHERVTLELTAELTSSPNSTVNVYEIKEGIGKRGFLKLAASLALKILERKGLVEFAEEEDHNGYSYWSVMVTDEGWLWFENNKESLFLEIPCRKLTSSTGSDDVPF